MNVKEYRIEISIVLIALFCTISALLISNELPNKQILVLTILTLLLPAIYQIGHTIPKEYIREKKRTRFLSSSRNNGDYQRREQQPKRNIKRIRRRIRRKHIRTLKKIRLIPDITLAIHITPSTKIPFFLFRPLIKKPFLKISLN